MKRLQVLTVWFVAALLTAISPQVRAENAPRDELRLDEVLRSVDRAFPLIAAASHDQDEAEGALLSAEGGFDPVVKASGTYEPIGGYPKQYFSAGVEQPTPVWGTTVFAGYRYGSGLYPVYDRKLETNELGEVRGGVKVPLWRDGPIDRRRASIRQAELAVSLAKLSVQQQRIEARRVAALRYFDWVAAGQRLDIVRSWLKLAAERDVGLAARAERGDIPAIERTENQRTILQRQIALIAAERELAQAGLELSLFLRDDNGRSRVPSPLRLPSKLPRPAAIPTASAEREEARALAERPDLKRFQLARERSRIDAELASNQQNPAVDLTVFGARQFGDGDPARGETVVGASLSLELPVLNRVQNGREQSANAAVARTDEQTRFARDRAVADVRSSLVAMETSRQRAAMAGAELRLATELAEAELRRFELGEGNLLLVNLREQAYAEAALREADASADYHRAVVNFRATTMRDVRN
jgi:outer membrane protein TolC